MINVFCYEHEGHGGDFKQIFKEGSGFMWQPKLGWWVWNDKISSIKVLDGYIAFFEHEDFNGSPYIMGPGTNLPDLRRGNWNDVISSYIACSRNFDAIAAAMNLRNSNYTNPNPC